MARKLDETDWDVLLRRIKVGKCTPFLGAGACYGVLPLGSDIAREWAKNYEYPLEDSTDLARVAQYVAVMRDPMHPKESIAAQIEKVKAPEFTERNELHGLLAKLPLPVYITTNYDDFMVQALKQRGRKPEQVVCRWNTQLQEEPSVFESEQGFVPSRERPVVFHLHGYTKTPESLVLTEDDYLDFLVNIARGKILPRQIEKAFTGASLLFLGYRIADWNFRVLFRSLVGHLEASLGRAHVSVQLVPGNDQLSQIQREKAQVYLDRYFDGSKIRVYWGTCGEFAAELEQRWNEFRLKDSGPIAKGEAVTV